MEKAKLALIDTRTNEIVESWQNVPNPLILPNGLASHGASEGSVIKHWKIVPYYIVDNKPSEYHQKIDENLQISNTQIISTYVYTEQPNIVPQEVSPLQMRKALRHIGIAEVVNNYVHSSNDQDLIDSWEYATTIRRDNQLIDLAGAALGKTKQEIDDLFRIADSY